MYSWNSWVKGLVAHVYHLLSLDLATLLYVGSLQDSFIPTDALTRYSVPHLSISDRLFRCKGNTTNIIRVSSRRVRYSYCWIKGLEETPR